MGLQVPSHHDCRAVDDSNDNGIVQSVLCDQNTGLLTAPKIVVIGCSGHARVVIDILEKENHCHTVGLLDSSKPRGTEALGFQVIGSEDDLPALIASKICDAVIVAIGDNWVRSRVVQNIRQAVPGIRFVAAVHPSAQIGGDVSIGIGTVIMPRVVVNAGCRIGEFCILNTSCSLDHDSTMEQFSSLAPQAVTGGGVSIGAFTAIAIGAVISHATRVGEHAVIGAGATVLKDVPDRVVAYGTPARIVRSRNPGDPYLGEGFNKGKSPSPGRAPGFAASKSLKLVPSTSAEWLTYIGRTAHDFFHTSEYHRLSEGCSNAKAWLAVYGTVDKFVAWPYLLQDIGRPAHTAEDQLRDITSVYGYTGPLTYGCDHDQAFLASAWKEMFDAWHSQSVVAIFARFHPLLGNHRWLPGPRNDNNAAETMGSSYSVGKTIAIDVSRSEAETWNSYSRHLRQDLRRLSRLGIVVMPDPEWASLEEFVVAYYSTMRRNNASPSYLFPRAHFRKLKEALGSHGTLMVARYGDEVLGAGLLIEYAGIVTLHLLGTHDRFKNMSPSKMIIHATQAWARTRGNHLFHLGGGRGNRDDDPLFRFKASFSKACYPFFMGRWILDRDAYDALTAERRKQATSFCREISETYFPAYRSPFQSVCPPVARRFEPLQQLNSDL